MGIWDEREPETVEAASSKEAAEKACGEHLTDRGRLGKLRAEVWQTSNPQKKEAFYST
jgi:hypothetical protein